MLRDFIPESKGKPEEPSLAFRDFVPEGGLPPGLIDKGARWSKPRSERDEPAEGAPLLGKDFIHEVQIVEGEGAPGSTLHAPGEAPGDFNLEPGARSVEPTSIPEPERPPVPKPEDRAGEFEIPPGYELKGIDENGEPIIRRKSGRLSKEEQAKKDAWDAEQKAAEEAGAKGGAARPGHGHGAQQHHTHKGRRP